MAIRPYNSTVFSDQFSQRRVQSGHALRIATFSTHTPYPKQVGFIEKKRIHWGLVNKRKARSKGNQNPACCGCRWHGSIYGVPMEKTAYITLRPSQRYFTSTGIPNEFLEKEGVSPDGELTYSRLRCVLPIPTALNLSVTIPPAEFGPGSSVYMALPS